MLFQNQIQVLNISSISTSIKKKNLLKPLHTYGLDDDNV